MVGVVPLQSTFVEADRDVIERRRDSVVGGREKSLVLEITQSVELAERRRRGGKERRGGSVGTDEVERAVDRVRAGDLELERGVRRRRCVPGERSTRSA